MRKFVLGDIHGAYRALQQCLDRSSFDRENDVLIQLGDVADGFDEVYECVEELLKIRNLVAIKGNHDEWLNEFCVTGYHEQHWSQGGRGTVSSYLKHADKKPDFITSKFFGFSANITPADIPESHTNFLRSQLLYHVDDDGNCYVHAGFNRFQDFYQQREQTYYWDRSLFIDAMEYEQLKRKLPDITFEIATAFKKIYIGHTNTIVWKTDQPLHAANIINMDTGAGWGGRLSIMEVGTDKLWQSDLVTELYGYRGR